MLVIKSSIIVTMDRNYRILKDHYLGIEDGHIRYIGKTKPHDYEEYLELDGKMVMPGLVNTHTHVAMTILRGLKDDVDLDTWLRKYILPLEVKLKAKDVYYGALYGIAEMIKNGVTCFLDMYYHEIEVARAAVDACVKAVLSFGSADIFFERTAEEEFKIIENFRKDLLELANQRNANDRIFFAYGPHSPYGCSRELLQLIREASMVDGSRIHIHLSETRREVQEVKKLTGRYPIEYLDEIGLLSGKTMTAHVVWPQDNEIDLLAKRGVHVLHNPTSNLKLASGVAPIPKMLEKGVNVALATDGPASNNRLDIWKEMHIAALIHKGVSLDPEVLSAKDVVKMATINGAKALGLDDIIGSIEVGKKADFIVVDLDKALETTPTHDIYATIVYCLDSRYIDSVWVDGKKLYSLEEGFSSIDVSLVRDKVQSIRERLLQDV